MSIKDIYKRLNLTSTLAKEQRKFIERTKEILLQIYDFYNYDEQKVIKREIAFEVGKSTLHIKYSIADFISGYSFEETLSLVEILLRILDNLKPNKTRYKYFTSKIEQAFSLSIVDLGYDFKDGKIYKKGAAELDEKLILEPLEWLGDFPKAKKFFEDSLREYLRKDYPDAITKSYSALESLVKTFLGNNKNLKDNSNKLIEKLDLPKEWGNILFNFCQYANEFSSRHGKKEGGKTIKVEPNLVEAYIYFTGLVMRLIIRPGK